MLEKIADESLDALSLSTALYFMAWAALRGRATLRAVNVLEDARERLISFGDDRLIAAYLLAFGATAGAVSGAEAKVDLASLKALLSSERLYIDYWVLEAWGRAARNPALGETVIRLLEDVSASNLGDSVAVRRKLSWEVYRLVEGGYSWPGLNAFLEKGLDDTNPDVRLLTYKTLVQCYSAVPSGPAILSAGLADEHEDVREWALRAHICLFNVLETANRSELSASLPALLMHPNYHIRGKAVALAELCKGAWQ